MSFQKKLRYPLNIIIALPYYGLGSESDTGYGRRDEPEMHFPNQFPVSLWLQSVPLLLHIQLKIRFNDELLHSFSDTLLVSCV